MAPCSFTRLLSLLVLANIPLGWCLPAKELGGCKVPAEFCQIETDASPVCIVPIGWTCGKDGEISPSQPDASSTEITNTSEDTAAVSEALGTTPFHRPGLRRDQPVLFSDPGLFPALETPTGNSRYIPIIHITCATLYRFLYSDFKVTWGPAYRDMETCARLERVLKKRVGWSVTGYQCKTAAAPVVGGYVMEATGHIPLGLRDELADSIRRTFMDYAIYYPSMDSKFLCYN